MERYARIDQFKIIAAILAIMNHTSPLLSYSETADMLLVRVFARIVVPFFFMVSGFFLLSESRIHTFSYRKFCKKTAKLYGIAILIYLPINFYSGFFEGLTFAGFLRALLLEGTMYHLWYFPAAMAGVGIIYLLRKHCSFWMTIWITATLYLIGLFGDSYYGFAVPIPVLHTFYDMWFQISEYTRNGLFFAPAFILLGSFCNHRLNLSAKKVGALLSFAMLLMLCEGFLLHQYDLVKHDSMYIASIPCLYLLFQWLLTGKGTTAAWVSRASTILYIIHPWFIILVRGFAKATNLQRVFIDDSLIHFLSVAILSTGFAVFFSYFLEKRKRPVYAADRAWIEVNLSSIQKNTEALKGVLADSCALTAVVKADAYGHGAVRVSQELQKIGITSFATASIDEAIALRKAKVKGEILILGYTHPERFADLKRYKLTQTVIDHSYGIALSEFGKELMVHLKVDTGMHRSGEDATHINEIVETLQLPNLDVKGIYSHLCVSDRLQKEDIAFTEEQIMQFTEMISRLRVLGCCPAQTHIQSSYGVLNYPEIACSYARVGISLYGVKSSGEDEIRSEISLEPALALKARITLIKEIQAGETVGYGRKFKSEHDMRIANVSIGYADGIPRNLKEGNVLIRGQKAPIIGRISMDQLSVDVTQISGVSQGDIATLIGIDGAAEITAEEVAKQADTITNEILSRLGKRLHRIYR